MTENTCCTVAENGAARNVAATPQDTVERERFASPAVDIYETKAGLVVIADVPGIDPASLEIAVEKDTLTIKAAPPAPREGEFLHREFETPGYFRQFRLGSKIAQDGIGAEVKNGVLRLSLPFAPENQPRPIAVKIGA